MKKVYIGLSIVILILIAVGVYLMTSDDNLISSDSSNETTTAGSHEVIEDEGTTSSQVEVDTSQAKPELCVVSRGQEYFDQIKTMATLGENVPSHGKFDFNKLGLSNPTGGKKTILTFSNSGCSGCQKFLPLFKEWVEKFTDDVEVKAVLYGPPSTNERIKKDLLSAGIETVATPDIGDLIAPEYQKYETLLLDNNGEIVYGLYSFDIPKWKIVKRLVDTFIKTGEVIDSKIDYISQGKQIEIPQTTDLAGNKYNTENFTGKPTVFFINWPNFRLTKNLYPVINDVRKAYEDDINFALVLYDNEDKIGRLTKEYYETYNIELNYIDQSIKDINSIVADKGLGDMPIFFDKEWKLFNYANMEVTPTAILCDKDLRVITVLSLGRCISVTAEGDLTVKEVIKETYGL